ncbi:MAG: hypothetical protein KC492_03400 [Myxococcales bacterium]|nr:hypothetical protein [Myxococcales bacterium]
MASALLSACGGAAPTAGSPSSDGEIEPESIPIADESDPEPQRTQNPTPPRQIVAEPEPATDSDCCRGRNECKGLGGCAVAGANDCRGKNECKGLGGCQAHCPD